MIGVIRVRDRGATPRNLRKVYTAAAKTTWKKVGLYFHKNLRDRRFTELHARQANYRRRKGEGMPRDSKGWRNSYTGRKFAKHGHTRPLEFSGETRRLVRSANISVTSKGAKVKYAGARKFNFKHPKSQIRMREEFSRVLSSEADAMAGVFDGGLDRTMKQSKTTSTVTLTRGT